jgi:hypothetical protein
MINNNSIHDPEGHITYKDGRPIRVLSDSYMPSYVHLMESGLYNRLIGNGYMVSHRELDYGTLQPMLIPFITYSNEWSFNQLKDGALLTLTIQQLAMEYGMSLKDASTNNIQFIGSKPIFIDTSSFEIYKEGQPWQAYRQFCEEFLIPLSLASYVSLECLKWRGVSLKLASKLIPKWHFMSGLGLHIYLHSLASKKRTLPKRTYISKVGLQGIIMNLYNTIDKLPTPKEETLWSNYYDKTINYDLVDSETKRVFVKDILTILSPKKVLDLGCNRGLYTQIIANESDYTLALDSDYQSIDSLYRRYYGNVLPLVSDLFEPSPDSGWMNNERASLIKRLVHFKFDIVFALALIHHLCFKGSIPLEQIALFFNQLGKWLVVEFVPELDSQIISMTRTLKTHHLYNKEVFLNSFKEYYEIDKAWELSSSKRVVYLMRRKDG